MDKDLIVIRIEKETKKKFKKIVEDDGQTMTSYLKLKIRDRIKKEE